MKAEKIADGVYLTVEKSAGLYFGFGREATGPWHWDVEWSYLPYSDRHGQTWADGFAQSEEEARDAALRAVRDEIAKVRAMMDAMELDLKEVTT